MSQNYEESPEESRNNEVEQADNAGPDMMRIASNLEPSIARVLRKRIFYIILFTIAFGVSVTTLVELIACQKYGQNDITCGTPNNWNYLIISIWILSFFLNIPYH